MLQVPCTFVGRLGQAGWGFAFGKPHLYSGPLAGAPPVAGIAGATSVMKLAGLFAIAASCGSARLEWAWIRLRWAWGAMCALLSSRASIVPELCTARALPEAG